MTKPRSYARWANVVSTLFCCMLLFPAALARGEETDDVTLADALEKQRFSEATRLLDKGVDNAVDVDAEQVDGMRALHWAVFHQKQTIVARLLKMKASPNAANRYGVTPLSIATSNGDADSVQLLLSAGADANVSLPGGETALLTAARTGDAKVVVLLLEAGADVDASISGQTPLMWAAAEGHAAAVKVLLEAGAKRDQSLASGFSAFSFAVREGESEVVEALLADGADVNSVMRPANRNAKSVRNGTSPLMLAVENGHFDLAVRLLEAGADPNDQRSGFTPLHALTWVRKPNRGDGADGQPSPEGSGRRDSLQFLRDLVARGAKVNARLKKGASGRGRLSLTGATAFLMAAKTADLEMMKLLVELGADSRIPNVDGATPVMTAAGLGTRAPFEEAGTEDEALAAVKWLLDRGADVNTRDKNGETAMHGAAYKNMPRMVALLEKRGAKIDIWNQRNRFGWSPLLIAEGHRPGNFKPSYETVAAIHQVMRNAGIKPPPPTPRKKRKGYE